MPCQAPPRGKTDLIRPWDPRVQNDPCGMPALVSVGGVNVANDNLCEQHWLLKYGQTPAYVAAKGGAGGGIADDGVFAQGSGGYGFDHAQPGLYVPPSGPFSWQTSASYGNSTRFGRLPCPVTMTITKIRFYVSVAATADDQVDVGIFNADLSVLLGSSGPVSGLLNVLGVRTANLLTPVRLVAGTVYQVGASTGPVGGTQCSLLMAQAVNLYCHGLFGTVPPQAEQRSQATPIFPLTAPATSSGIPAAFPILALVQ